MSDELYDLLPEAPLHWFCDGCDKKALSRGQSDVEASVVKMLENLMERVKSIEAKLGEGGGQDLARTVKSSIEKMEGKLEEKIGSGLASYAAAASQKVTQGATTNQEVKPMREIIKEAMAQQAEEEKEIEKRNKNVIIYRVPETTSGDRGASELEDQAFLKSLMEGPLEIAHVSGAVKQITRLGKKTEGTGGRPMLVKLATDDDKREFMGSLKNLKSADEKFKKISVAHDLTPKQREAVKGALEAAKREQLSQDGAVSGSQSGNWVFRVLDQQKIPRVVRVKVG
jgi:hypothetical protein